MEKRDMQFVRLAVRRRWMTPEEGEDCIFLRRKFGEKYAIEEVARRRNYLTDPQIGELLLLLDEPGPGADILDPASMAQPRGKSRVIVEFDQARLAEVSGRPMSATEDTDAVARKRVPRDGSTLDTATDSDDNPFEEATAISAAPRPELAVPAVSPIPPPRAPSRGRAASGVMKRPVAERSGPAPPVERTTSTLQAGAPAPARSPTAAPVRPRAPSSAIRPAELDDADDPTGVGDAIKRGKFGPFKILRRVAQGATGTVYLAEHQDRPGVPLALKVLRPDVSAAHLARFQRGARAVARVESAHVVPILEVGVYRKHHYAVMPYVDGFSLKERIESGDTPEVAELVRIARDVAKALVAAHGAGIVHRDVKPDNILVSKDGVVFLADFGLALDLSAPGAPKEEEETIVGTPNYLAPEQARGEAIDGRADLYSLGATLYHVLAGRPVFHGRNAMSIIAKHVKVPAPRLDKLDPQLPPALVAIVQKLLEKDPARRFQTAPDLAQLLAGLRAELKARGPESTRRVRSLRSVIPRAAGVTFAAIAVLFVLVRLVGVRVPIEGPLVGAASAGAALFMLAVLALVRRGELPMPGSTRWLVSLRDAAGTFGSVVLIATSLAGPPAVLNAAVAFVAAIALLSWIYGILLRRAVASLRRDRGVGHVLAVLGDPSLRGWGTLHAPLLTTLVVLAGIRALLAVYFRGPTLG